MTIEKEVGECEYEAGDRAGTFGSQQSSSSEAQQTSFSHNGHPVVGTPAIPSTGPCLSARGPSKLVQAFCSTQCTEHMSQAAAPAAPRATSASRCRVMVQRIEAALSGSGRKNKRQNRDPTTGFARRE